MSRIAPCINKEQHCKAFHERKPRFSRFFANIYPVFFMGCLLRCRIFRYFYERDISKVKKGQKAEIFIDGIKKPFKGIIKDVGFQVYKNDVNQTDPLSNRDNRVVEVRIDIVENDSLDLIKHMIYRQVQVRILS